MDKFNPAIPQMLRVISNQQETKEVFTLTLAYDSPFTFKPGQFNMLYGYGRGESAISISGSADNKHIKHTIRAVGSVTKFLCQTKKNDTIGVRGPFGTAWPMEKLLTFKHILFIAGGIGMAPIRAAIHALTSHRNNNTEMYLLPPSLRASAKQSRKEIGNARLLRRYAPRKDGVSSNAKISLIYGARTPDDLLFQNEILSWSSIIKTYLTVDHAPLSWKGEIGVTPSFIPKALKAPQQTLVIMCGPEVMMRFCLMRLLAFKVNPENIYLSLERNMQCGFGQCGHCQWGPYFLCKDGPVMSFDKIYPFFYKKEL